MIDFDFGEYMLLEKVAILCDQANMYLLEADAITPTKEQLPHIDPITGKNWRATDMWRHLAAVVKDQAVRKRVGNSCRKI
jgi:hypothetical protein